MCDECNDLGYKIETLPGGFERAYPCPLCRPAAYRRWRKNSEPEEAEKRPALSPSPSPPGPPDPHPNWRAELEVGITAGVLAMQELYGASEREPGRRETLVSRAILNAEAGLGMKLGAEYRKIVETLIGSQVEKELAYLRRVA
jgi:hypothetical protein